MLLARMALIRALLVKERMVKNVRKLGFVCLYCTSERADISRQANSYDEMSGVVAGQLMASA